jgi:phospholipase D1/2
MRTLSLHCPAAVRGTLLVSATRNVQLSIAHCSQGLLKMDFIDKVKTGFERLEARLKDVHISKKATDQHSHTDLGDACQDLHTGTENRFHSFAPPRHGNAAKFFVDGCSYFWAVSIALEEAKESIWILDWWLSPELYLRRPPSENAQYRLDRMLFAAADRGVDVNIIVYKEVPSVLTCESSAIYMS